MFPSSSFFLLVLGLGLGWVDCLIWMEYYQVNGVLIVGGIWLDVRFVENGFIFTLILIARLNKH